MQHKSNVSGILTLFAISQKFAVLVKVLEKSFETSRLSEIQMSEVEVSFDDSVKFHLILDSCFLPAMMLNAVSNFKKKLEASDIESIKLLVFQDHFFCKLYPLDLFHQSLNRQFYIYRRHFW